MKDPCEDCLVKVTCSVLCDEKRNYATLIQNGIQQLRSNLRYGGNVRKQYLKYLEMAQKQVDSVSKIRNRRQHPK